MTIARPRGRRRRAGVGVRTGRPDHGEHVQAV